MRGTTPRSLNLPGALGVLGLAAMLLPLSPTWAQDEGAASSADKVATTPSGDAPKSLNSEELLLKLKVDTEAKLHDFNRVLKELNPENAADLKRTAEHLQTIRNNLLQQARDLRGEDQDDDAKKLGILKRKIDAAELVDVAIEIGADDKIEGRAAELAKAKAAVALARNQLEMAEKRLAALQGEMKETVPARPNTVVRPRKPASSSAAKAELAGTLIRRRGDDKAPASDQRIAEIESTLQKLMDEVKMLKGEREKPR